MAGPPILVFGPRSLDYDFGPAHPLTPRRFGPGIDLLEAFGGSPSLAPVPASDDELAVCHTTRYIETVRQFSMTEHGWIESAAGIGFGSDDPPFRGMHEAAAAVAGGSVRAMDAILERRVVRAFHPGGGLHHAMPDRAAGFCIYNDVALAVARARAAGLRVLYVDLDVHHGDGVQVIHAPDPGVMTISIHENPRYLFPSISGFATEIGEGTAAGTVVNVPLEPETGEGVWLGVVERILPELAAAFGPDVIVSQHGADSHARDPLAHLRNSTTAMRRAALLVAALADRWSGGRWLATGGGGYRVYDVVPRMWTGVWLAMTGAESDGHIPLRWRGRWADDATRFGVPSLPTTLDDLPNVGDPLSAAQDLAERRSSVTAEAVSATVTPALIRAAVTRGWWDALAATGSGSAGRAARSTPAADARIVAIAGRAGWDALRLAPRVVLPADTATAHGLVGAALDDGATVTAAVARKTIVGLVVSAPATDGSGTELLLAVGVAPRVRRQGLATRLLAAHLEALRPRPVAAVVTVAERDPIEPLDRATRRDVAAGLLARAGFDVTTAPDPVGRIDPGAILARRRA